MTTLVLEFPRRALFLALACCLALVWTNSVAAQGNVGVNARLSSGVVKLGGDVKLVVEVEGANTASIVKLPDVAGLRFGPIGQPNVQTFFQSINGRQTVSRSMAWVITALPQKEGEYTVPSFDVIADGKTVATKPLALKVVQDMKGEDLGVFVIDAPSQVVEGQPFTLEMRFGWDMALANQINYAKLSAPWLSGFPALLELDPPPTGAGVQRVKIALNETDEIVVEQLGEQKEGQKSAVILRVRKRFLATRSGTIELPTTFLEFGRQNQDFFSRPSAVTSYFKRAPTFSIEVLKLPEENRPLDFSGGVGTFEATATADRRLVKAGESIKLSVEWRGKGNLEFFDSPDLARLDAFKGFRFYGKVEGAKTNDRRVTTYDIAPLSADVKEIPPVPLSIYDLEKKAYRTISTAPIPISVTPLEKTSGLGDAGPRTGVVIDIRDVQTRAQDSEESRGPTSKVLVGTLALVLGGWFGLRTKIRRRGDPDAPRARARRAAKKQLVRSLANAKSASEQARALQTFLAARSGESREAWAGRDVRAWAAIARDSDASDAPRLSDEDARALADMFARLDERIYGGRDDALDAAAIGALADRLAKGGL